MNLHIKNGRLIDPANGIDAISDLFIADGKIAATGSAPAGFEAARTIDAAGLVVAPGLVDLSARLREPGYEYKATLESEMQAAMQGGVTSLVCPPDTDPVLDEPGLVEMLQPSRAQAAPGKRVSAGRADRRLERRGADRDGRADRFRLHRLRPGRGTDRRHHCAAARPAICPDLRLHRLVAPAGRRTSAAAASPTAARWLRAWACPACRSCPRPSPCTRFSN